MDVCVYIQRGGLDGCMYMCTERRLIIRWMYVYIYREEASMDVIYMYRDGGRRLRWVYVYMYVCICMYVYVHICLLNGSVCVYIYACPGTMYIHPVPYAYIRALAPTTACPGTYYTACPGTEYTICTCPGRRNGQGQGQG